MSAFKHKSSVGFVSLGQKTAKTECGKIVKVSALAIDCATDCPGCREKVQASIAALQSVAAEFRKRWGDIDTTREADKAAADPAIYNTARFL